MMKEYKIFIGYAETLEHKINECAKEGYTIDKVLQQDSCGSHICIIMVRDRPEEK